MLVLYSYRALCHTVPHFTWTAAPPRGNCFFPKQVGWGRVGGGGGDHGTAMIPFPTKIVNGISPPPSLCSTWTTLAVTSFRL